MVKLNVKKSSLLLITAGILWTFICWSVYKVVIWLPALSGSLNEGAIAKMINDQVMGIIPLPQSWIEAWIPLLASIYMSVNSTFLPEIVNWLGIIIWIVWGFGFIVAFLLLYI